MRRRKTSRKWKKRFESLSINKYIVDSSKYVSKYLLPRRGFEKVTYRSNLVRDAVMANPMYLYAVADDMLMFRFTPKNSELMRKLGIEKSLYFYIDDSPYRPERDKVEMFVKVPSFETARALGRTFLVSEIKEQRMRNITEQDLKEVKEPEKKKDKEERKRHVPRHTTPTSEKTYPHNDHHVNQHTRISPFSRQKYITEEDGDVKITKKRKSGLPYKVIQQKSESASLRADLMKKIQSETGKKLVNAFTSCSTSEFSELWKQFGEELIKA